MEQQYETAVKRLEEIVQLLDDGKLPLSESLQLFSEGTTLLKYCNDYLEKAEQKITELTEKPE